MLGLSLMRDIRGAGRSLFILAHGHASDSDDEFCADRDMADVECVSFSSSDALSSASALRSTLVTHAAASAARTRSDPTLNWEWEDRASQGEPWTKYLRAECVALDGALLAGEPSCTIVNARGVFDVSLQSRPMAQTNRVDGGGRCSVRRIGDSKPALSIGTRVRVWWAVGASFFGTVSTIEDAADSDSRFTVTYDDGNVRHYRDFDVHRGEVTSEALRSRTRMVCLSLSSSGALDVGALVRVKPSVTTPARGWGRVSHSDVGTIVAVGGGGCIVNFPSQSSWAGKLDEMERVGCGSVAKNDGKGKAENIGACPALAPPPSAIGADGDRLAVAAKTPFRVRPVVGDTVRLARDHGAYADAANGPLMPSDVGKLLADDGTAKPLQVQAADGRTWWYEVGAICKRSAQD